MATDCLIIRQGFPNSSDTLKPTILKGKVTSGALFPLRKIMKRWRYKITFEKRKYWHAMLDGKSLFYRKYKRELMRAIKDWEAGVTIQGAIASF